MMYSYNDFLNMMLEKKFEEKLIKLAQEIRDKQYGRKLFVRATLEVSNFCQNNCLYCGMASSNKKLERYKIGISEIENIIYEIKESGIKHVHLVSGEHSDIEEELLTIVKILKMNNLSVTGVFGIVSQEMLYKLKNIGLDKYITKFETSNEKIFEIMKPKNSYKERIEYIKTIKKMGFKVGSGNILGLPGTTLMDYYNDLKLLEDLNVNMASTSLFFSNSFSKLKYSKVNKNLNIFRYLAIIRIFLENISPIIPISSSFGENSIEKGIKYGANLISVPFTPINYGEKFSLYYDKNNKRIRRTLENIFTIANKNNMEISDYD